MPENYELARLRYQPAPEGGPRRPDLLLARVQLPLLQRGSRMRSDDAGLQRLRVGPAALRHPGLRPPQGDRLLQRRRRRHPPAGRLGWRSTPATCRDMPQFDPATAADLVHRLTTAACTSSSPPTAPGSAASPKRPSATATEGRRGSGRFRPPPLRSPGTLDRMTETPLLRTAGLTKRYGGVTALDGLTVEVPRGLVGLVGANGAGKTTLFRLLLGLARPTEGTVEVCGHAVAADPIGVAVPARLHARARLPPARPERRRRRRHPRASCRGCRPGPPASGPPRCSTWSGWTRPASARWAGSPPACASG